MAECEVARLPAPLERDTDPPLSSSPCGRSAELAAWNRGARRLELVAVLSEGGTIFATRAVGQGGLIRKVAGPRGFRAPPDGSHALAQVEEASRGDDGSSLVPDPPADTSVARHHADRLGCAA